MVEQRTIPQSVHKALLAVRESGLVNMLDRPGVQAVLDTHGEYDACDWVDTNRDTYASWVFGKVKVDEAEDA